MDYEYETRIAVADRGSRGIETVFLVAAAESSFISSTLMKEILAAGGSVDAFVPEPVAKALRAGNADPRRRGFPSRAIVRAGCARRSSSAPSCSRSASGSFR